MIIKNPTSIKNKQKVNNSSARKKALFSPWPYRIIIRLSETNPSAPGETVTSVLRDAGVKFEENLKWFVLFVNCGACGQKYTDVLEVRAIDDPDEDE